MLIELSFVQITAIAIIIVKVVVIIIVVVVVSSWRTLDAGEASVVETLFRQSITATVRAHDSFVHRLQTVAARRVVLY